MPQDKETMGERARDSMAAIIQALTDAGRTVEEGSGKRIQKVDCATIMKVDGTTLSVAITPQSYSGGFTASYNGKLTLTIGSYPDTKSYPEPKKGFDVAKSAERVLESLARKKRRDESEAKEQSKAKAVESEAKEIRDALDSMRGLVYQVATHSRGNHFTGSPPRAYDHPLVSFNMTVMEAYAVGALLYSMRKGEVTATVRSEAEAYGDEDGLAGAEAGVEHEEI